MHCNHVLSFLHNRVALRAGCVIGRQTTPITANELGKVPHSLLPSSRSSGHELMHAASDEMQRRIKVLCQAYYPTYRLQSCIVQARQIYTFMQSMMGSRLPTQAARPAVLRVKAGQPFLKVVGAPPAAPGTANMLHCLPNIQQQIQRRGLYCLHMQTQCKL